MADLLELAQATAREIHPLATPENMVASPEASARLLRTSATLIERLARKLAQERGDYV